MSYSITLNEIKAYGGIYQNYGMSDHFYRSVLHVELLKNIRLTCTNLLSFKNKHFNFVGELYYHTVEIYVINFESKFRLMKNDEDRRIVDTDFKIYCKVVINYCKYLLERFRLRVWHYSIFCDEVQLANYLRGLKSVIRILSGYPTLDRFKVKS